MTSYLFVYGSLTSIVGHPMGDRLRQEAQLLGEAAITGRLFRVSWYPAAVDADDPVSLVHGEVYALADPGPTLEWLDTYEGIVAGAPDSEYARVERPARLASGKTLTAWVYLYRKDVRRLQAVPDGRWRTREG